MSPEKPDWRCVQTLDVNVVKAVGGNILGRGATRETGENASNVPNLPVATHHLARADASPGGPGDSASRSLCPRHCRHRSHDKDVLSTVLDLGGAPEFLTGGNDGSPLTPIQRPLVGGTLPPAIKD
jgi:hypothetical protein